MPPTATDQLEDLVENEEGFRSIEGAVADTKVEGDKHTVTFEFPHEVLDGYRTDWGQRCFDESLSKLLPPMLWQHMPTEPIGRADSYESTGKRTIVHNRFSDFSGVPRAEQAFVQLRDGDIPGASFHFRNGRSVRHPTERSGRRYLKADMIETSPVSFPAIPGAGATDVRGLAVVTQQPVIATPDLPTVLKLHEDGIINDEGLRALLTEHYPALRDHITVVTPQPTADERITALLADEPELAAHFADLQGARAISVDGGVVTDDGADDPETLIRAIDATLDHAVAATSDLSEGDRAALPAGVQQALALTQAAGVAVDELQEVLGIDDPDDPLEGQRAQWSTADVNDLPDSSFAYIESGGSKDDDGKTTPRSLRHYPIKDADGKPDKAHVDNAKSRAMGALNGGDKDAADIAKKALPAINKASASLDSDGSRSIDDKLDGAMGVLDRRIAS